MNLKIKLSLKLALDNILISLIQEKISIFLSVGDLKYYDNSLGPISDLLGFYEVEVTAPKDLDYPILQRRVNVGHGFRTVAHLGTWKGVYFSEEIKKDRKSVV